MVWLEYVWFYKKLPNCLPKWLYHFAFPPAMNESSCCSISSPAFGIVSVLDLEDSNKCVVVSHCCFNLHFPDGIQCRAYFCMLICHLVIFLDEVSVKVFGPFLNWVVFSSLSFKSSLYILNNSLLSDVSLANIFS